MLPISKNESLVVERTARVFNLVANPDLDPTELWIVLHGYGETADAFLSRMSELATETRALCAPEALSRYYVDGAGGTVGATWMTSRFRADEIRDYLSYLNSVAENWLRRAPGIGRVVVLGFSQGTSTASRWVAETSIPVDQLILCGGAVAADINVSALRRKLGDTAIQLVVGTKDNYVTPERLVAEQDRLTSLDLPFVLHQFAGGHRLDLPTLLEIASGVDQ